MSENPPFINQPLWLSWDKVATLVLLLLSMSSHRMNRVKGDIKVLQILIRETKY